MQEALKNNVDLSVYGNQIEKELDHFTSVSVQDYIRESKNSATLHLFRFLPFLTVAMWKTVYRF